MEGNHDQGSDSSVPIMVHHGLAGKQGGEPPLPGQRMIKPLTFVRGFPRERRARDLNPQPLTGHLISNEVASQFAYPPANEPIK